MIRVVIYTSEDGFITVHSDDGVEVFWVDERAPNDRSYRMTPTGIPDGMLDDAPGFKGDGSAAEVRCKRIASEIDGQPFLELVSDGKSGTGEGVTYE